MNDRGRQRWPKRIRLARHHYEVPNQVVSITVSCDHRHPFFANHTLATRCIESLQHAAEQRSILVLGYCFMPDHLHLLLQPTTTTNIIDFIQRYKSFTTRLARETSNTQRLWQPRFYDHILRENEHPMKHLRYIVENPVRAGLVGLWQEYPYVGSFVYDVDKFDW